MKKSCKKFETSKSQKNLIKKQLSKFKIEVNYRQEGIQQCFDLNWSNGCTPFTSVVFDFWWTNFQSEM